MLLSISLSELVHHQVSCCWNKPNESVMIICIFCPFTLNLHDNLSVKVCLTKTLIYINLHVKSKISKGAFALSCAVRFLGQSFLFNRFKRSHGVWLAAKRCTGK